MLAKMFSVPCTLLCYSCHFLIQTCAPLKGITKLLLFIITYSTVVVLSLFLGAAALVKHLQACGIPLAVATGSSLHTYQLKVSSHSDVFSRFHHVVCSDDSEVKNGKPSPDIYLTAAKRFSILPQSNNHVCIR